MTATRPFSATLNELIVLSEEVITRPSAQRDPRWTERMMRVAAEVRRADARPCDGPRTSFGAMSMVVTLEGLLAAQDEQKPLWRMHAASALELVRIDAYQELCNTRERQG
ncbi:hypothetical protein RPPS3_25440 [Rhodopseudomonas palustris]|uniref:hypothetical protein n=1 Tax=Rhodopseudomonas palustris TaxID=1076 RepID=UPI000D1BD696|nr:hypothetical protein [Rhodopseudomonas palustris]AVT76607.1 hypothetical protein RPPS3_25440 [Rhodopseudomonas palustris]